MIVKTICVVCLLFHPKAVLLTTMTDRGVCSRMEVDGTETPSFISHPSFQMSNSSAIYWPADLMIVLITWSGIELEI